MIGEMILIKFGITLSDTIGMEYLVALHLNDSKSDVGSRVDRHDNIGMGKIGKEAFKNS